MVLTSRASTLWRNAASSLVNGHCKNAPPAKAPDVWARLQASLAPDPIGLRRLRLELCRLLIRPKVSLRALFHLLDPQTDPDIDAVPLAGAPGVEVLWFLARRLTVLLSERVVAGLHRSYAEQADKGPFLQGRLDVAAQLREGAAHRDSFHCRRDDFTTDVLCNQVPRATLELLLRSGLVDEPLTSAYQGNRTPS